MTPYYEQDGITIYHGDCREVLPLLDVTVDLVLTDPPYGIGFRGYLSHVDDPSTHAALQSIAIAMAARLVSVGWFVLFVSTERAPEWHSMVPNQAWTIAVFPKSFAQIYPGIGFRKALDVALVWKYGEPDWPAKTDRPRNWHVCTANVAASWRAEHPCSRPIEAMAHLMPFARPSRYVVDPFMGIGTTLVAAKEHGRLAIGIEIEERYCEIAARRLAQGVLSLSMDEPASLDAVDPVLRFGEEGSTRG